MRFLTPPFLALLILVPLAVAFMVWRERIRQSTLLLVGNTGGIQALYQRLLRRRTWKSLLWLLTIAALVLATARPVWGVDIDVVETEGVSIFFVLDVSNSMNAQDIPPSRLERAKLSVQEMFKGLAGNEMGLILFAGEPIVQFPLTTDSYSIGTFLDAASSSSISKQGTDIGAALHLAITSFDPAVTAKRFVVLITDGENLQGDIDSALGEAAQNNVTIDAIGYGGTDGAAIPIRDHNGQITGYQSDSAGNLVLSKLDETTLQKIADQTGGIYQRATDSGQEVARVVDSIKQSAPSALDQHVQTHDVERFEIFVALAVLALTAEILLPEMGGKAA